MKDAFFIISTAKGVRRLVKGRQHRWQDSKLPALSAGEYAVLLSIEIPDSIFRPRPTPLTTIWIAESAIVAPPVEVEVLDPPEQEAKA